MWGLGKRREPWTADARGCSWSTIAERASGGTPAPHRESRDRKGVRLCGARASSGLHRGPLSGAARGPQTLHARTPRRPLLPTDKPGGSQADGAEQAWGAS